MKKSLQFTLPTRKDCIAHWKFKGNLTDESPNGNDLSYGTGISVNDFNNGYTEDGLTTIDIDTSPTLLIPQASATDFNMATNSFSVELIFRTTGGVQNQFLIKKYDSTDGWFLTYFTTTGRPLFHIDDDAGNSGTIMADNATGDIRDGNWHYLVVTVDRENDELRLYIDGTEQTIMSPVDISSVTGNIGSSSDFILGEGLPVEIDELNINQSVLTSAEILNRYTGKFVEVSSYEEDFLIKFLPRINQDNADLSKFLIPFNTEYRGMMNVVDDLSKLLTWDECPEKFISHVASCFGFELIDIPFATERERRNFLKWIVWIYERKGTRAALEKIITLLGFTVVFTEDIGFYVNYISSSNHRIWSRELLKDTSNEIFDDFSSFMAQWNQPANLGSWWRINSGKLRATGNGSDDATNHILTNQGNIRDFVSVKFEVISGTAANDEIGIILGWTDSSNYGMLKLTDESGVQKLGIWRASSGLGDQWYGRTGDISSIVDWQSGEHTLWFQSVFTGVGDKGVIIESFGIDGHTFSNGLPKQWSGSGVGLFCNRGLTVDFDDFNSYDYDKGKAPQIFDPSNDDRNLTVNISGTPQFVTAKTDYLKRIVDRYIPFGVTASIT